MTVTPAGGVYFCQVAVKVLVAADADDEMAAMMAIASSIFSMVLPFFDGVPVIRLGENIRAEFCVGDGCEKGG